VLVLVTGGSGHVGEVVCRHLAQSHEVVNFDSQPPREPFCRFIRGDILNSAHLMEAMRGIEGVVHLAAIPHPNWDPSDSIMNVNVMGTQRVVEAAALGSPTRVVTASSDSTFGFVFGRGEILPQYLPVDEDHPTRPMDSYGLSKVLGEEICKRYTRDIGLETVCLRYCWVWDPETYSSLGGMADSPENFVGQLWGYVDVRDVAQAVEKSLEAPGIRHETLLISADRTFQKRPSLELAEQFLPEGIEIRDEELFAVEPRRTFMDCRRAKKMIGFAPEFDCWRESGTEV